MSSERTFNRYGQQLEGSPFAIKTKIVPIISTALAPAKVDLKLKGWAPHAYYIFDRRREIMKSSLLAQVCPYMEITRIALRSQY